MFIESVETVFSSAGGPFADSVDASFTCVEIVELAEASVTLTGEVVVIIETSVIVGFETGSVTPDATVDSAV